MDYESNYTFSGRLTKDPEQRRTETGKLVVNFTIAHEHKNKKTSFYRCIAWEQTGEIAMMLGKGASVLVDTTPTNNSWTDAKGEKHYTTDYIVRSIFFLDKKKKDDDEDINDIELPF